MTRRVWFHLVDQVGTGLTKVFSVSVTDDVVSAFLEEVKKMYSDSYLVGVAPSNLRVFTNQEMTEELPAEALIGSFGRTLKDALIVQSPLLTAPLSVRSNLKRLQVPFSTRDLNYLLNKDPARYHLLMLSGLIPTEARMIREVARAAIKSITQQAIAIREGVLLDGPLKLSQGQGKSGFYYAYSGSGGISVAKVYGEKYEREFQREVDVNRALGAHDNIVQFTKSFSIVNAEKVPRHIIVMPFFARSAADLLDQQSPVDVRVLATIARDCFSALCHIHSKNYCFADLKPANIMLHFGEQGGATLVDFGGAVEIGDPIVEVTEQFCLDVEWHGSELFDWTCLGTTLAQLAGIDIGTFNSRLHLSTFLSESRLVNHQLVEQLIISCLENPVQAQIEAVLMPLVNAFCQ